MITKSKKNLTQNKDGSITSVLPSLPWASGPTIYDPTYVKHHTSDCMARGHTAKCLCPISKADLEELKKKK